MFQRVLSIYKEFLFQFQGFLFPIPGIISLQHTRRNGGIYKLDHAVTRTQKIILSSFGLDEDSILDSANEISKLLASSKSLMNTEESDNGAEEIDSNN